MLTMKQAQAWWDDFNGRLITPCPRPRIILTALPKRQDGRWVTGWYRAGTVYLWRGAAGAKAEWTAFHEYAHHLNFQWDWWGDDSNPRHVLRTRFANAAYSRGGPDVWDEAFECALAFLMLGRWHAGCPQVRNLAPMLRPLLKETS